MKSEYGITLADRGKEWSLINARLAFDSLSNIDSLLNGQLKSTVGGGTWTIIEHTSVDGSQYRATTSGTDVEFETLGSQAIRQMNIYHEFGHVLDNSPGLINVFSDAVENLDNPSFIQGPDGDNPGFLDPGALISGRVSDPNHGTAQAIQHASIDRKEKWADIFANYVAGNIDMSKPTGPGMEMYNFVTDALAQYIGTP